MEPSRILHTHTPVAFGWLPRITNPQSGHKLLRIPFQKSQHQKYFLIIYSHKADKDPDLDKDADCMKPSSGA